MLPVLVLPLLVAFLFWWSLRRPTPLREPLLTRLTSDSGLTTDAVISPDGKLIAYASDRGGSNLDIWVKQVVRRRSHSTDATTLQTITSLHSLPTAVRSSFDPSGRAEGSTLFQRSGAKSRLLAPKGRNPRFSPAGDWIAFWVGPIAGHPLGAQAGKIFLIPPTGGAPKQIEPPGILAAGLPDLVAGWNSPALLWQRFDEPGGVVFQPQTGGCGRWLEETAVKTGAFEPLRRRTSSLTLPSPVPAPGRVDRRPGFLQCKGGRQCELVAGLHLAEKLANHRTCASSDFRIGTGDSPVPDKNGPARLFQSR